MIEHRAVSRLARPPEPWLLPWILLFYTIIATLAML